MPTVHGYFQRQLDAIPDVTPRGVRVYVLDRLGRDSVCDLEFTADDLRYLLARHEEIVGGLGPTAAQPDLPFCEGDRCASP